MNTSVKLRGVSYAIYRISRFLETNENHGFPFESLSADELLDYLNALEIRRSRLLELRSLGC